MLYAEHRGPLSADLRRYYQCDLWKVEKGLEEIPLREIANWVDGLPPDSAVRRARQPDGRWQYDFKLELMRMQSYQLDGIHYQLAKRNGVKNMDRPEPYLFPWEEDEDKIRGDAMEMEEADDWLGWTQEMKDHLNGMDLPGGGS